MTTPAHLTPEYPADADGHRDGFKWMPALGGDPADDEAVITDPEYAAVLRRCGRLDDLADAARKAQEEWA